MNQDIEAAITALTAANKWIEEAKPLLERGGLAEFNYNELLFAVAWKFEGETRHQTALRYIMEAEKRAANFPVASETPPSP